ncbi:LppX_LprAFG lipoprotein [Ornithinimicrobium ciconiae]|uniref:LppX_LprAFG lipoprotein n=1 Tax=Ornithinimicrobium ciconiae TaxID=2594265 RepID=A0A516GEW1_9MICO|nr:LppX_LprAFG lipoprotein [Ornithinimicrobium ciconiae]QDO90073.1 LppX_LprAFG lipoprotein [Ornithinimicrobium ciconiae]
MRINGHTRRAGLPLALVVATALTLTACSDGDEPDTDAATTTEPTASDRLEQAHATLVEAGSVRLVLEGIDLPDSAIILKASGSGTMEPAAFDGTITAKVAGVQADVPTIAVDDTLYVKLPFSPGFISTTPEDLKVPDPARLFDVDDGLAGLLTLTEGAEFGEQTRVGADVTQQITGTLPGQSVVDLLYVGDADQDFDVAYGLIEDSWEVRTVTITGPFYPPDDATYEVTIDQYGEPVTVTAP